MVEEPRRENKGGGPRRGRGGPMETTWPGQATPHPTHPPISRAGEAGPVTKDRCSIFGENRGSDGLKKSRTGRSPRRGVAPGVGGPGLGGETVIGLGYPLTRQVLYHLPS